MIGQLNLKLMRLAASYLEGTHDFRNFSKLDKTKLNTNYVRTIESIKIIKLAANRFNEDHQDIYELEIKSTAFLWHQIRNIVTILFLIGNGNEVAEIVLDLFDLVKFNKKPQYCLANELPLVLFNCEFDVDNWRYDEEAIKDAIASLNEFYIENTIKSVITLSMLNDLKKQSELSANNFQKYFVKDLNCKNYKKLADRQRCETVLNENKKTKLNATFKHRLIDRTVMANNCKKMKLDDRN